VAKRPMSSGFSGGAEQTKRPPAIDPISPARSAPTLPDAVRTQADAIRDALSRHGWLVADVERPFENEWWATEIWQIESNWSPQGVTAYLTFQIDPEGTPDDVWAVCASQDQPTRRPTSRDPAVSLHHVWQQEVPEFVTNLSRFRSGGMS